MEENSEGCTVDSLLILKLLLETLCSLKGIWRVLRFSLKRRLSLSSYIEIILTYQMNSAWIPWESFHTQQIFEKLQGGDISFLFLSCDHWF